MSEIRDQRATTWRRRTDATKTPTLSRPCGSVLQSDVYFQRWDYPDRAWVATPNWKWSTHLCYTQRGVRAALCFSIRECTFSSRLWVRLLELAAVQNLPQPIREEQATSRTYVRPISRGLKSSEKWTKSRESHLWWCERNFKFPKSFSAQPKKG